MAKNRGMPPLRQGVVVPSPVRPLLDQAGRLLAAGKGAEALPIVERAVALARANPEAVAIGSTDGASAALKQRLQENIPSCPLFSTVAIARNLEAAYLGMIESSAR